MSDDNDYYTEFACSISQRICVQDLPSVERSLCAREKHKRRRNLAGLTGPSERRPLAERLHALCGAAGGLERRVDGRWRDGVDADAVGHELLRERLREAHDGSLGRAVVHHGGRPAEGDGRGRREDARALVHVRQRVFRHREHLEDVRAEGGLDVIYSRVHGAHGIGY